MKKKQADGRTRVGRKALIEVVTSDLRALLFWASVGVAKTRGGKYANEMDHILESYSEYLGFKLPHEARFGSALKKEEVA